MARISLGERVAPVAGMLLLCLIMLPARVLPAQDNQTQPAGIQPESEPHLIFKKSLMVKPYKGGQAYVEPHTIKPGEHLWKILREQYQLSNTHIAFYCRIAKDVNREVADLNMLAPDQRILIPYKYVEQNAAGPVPEQPPGSDVEHVVRAGEHFGSIVRRFYRLPNHVLFNQETIQRFLQANPELADVNLLEKGQRVKIPAALFAPQEPPASVLSSEQRGAPGPVSRRQERTRAEAPQTQATATPPDQQGFTGILAEGDNQTAGAGVKDVLAVVARSLDGIDNSSGSETITFPGQEALTLDHAKYPVYSFPGGKKVLLDIGGSLPHDVRQAIASSWQNTEVLAVHDRNDMESILDKVLEASGFYKVEKNGEYIVSRDNVQITLNGQWIVFKDTMLKNVVIVNLVKPGAKAIPAEFASYLAGLGLKVVDVRPGQGSAVQKQKTAEPEKKSPVQQLPQEAAAIADSIFDILGLPYQKEYRTNIFQNIYSGVSLEVVVDRMFTRENATYLVDLQGLPQKISDIMRQQGVRLLQIDPQQHDPLRTARQLLDFCGAHYSGPPARLDYASGEKSNIKLTIPGILLKDGSRSVLFTHADLQPQILQLITDFGIHIIKI